MEQNRDELPNGGIFAPWTWKRRWWVVAVVLGLLGYLLTAAPAEYLVNRLDAPPWSNTVRGVAFEPAYLVLRNSTLAMKIFVWELTFMDALFGETEKTQFYSGQLDTEEN